ncbi:MAG: hypothetical protein ACRDRX_27120 [Pseudonocardiaceae bacterium]
MSAAVPRPAQDPWRDSDGAHLSLFDWVGTTSPPRRVDAEPAAE